MQPRAVAWVVVLIMADVQGVRRLAQRMSCKLPPGARAQHVHAQLRVVRYRVFCAARRIALPRDDEHIAHAHIVHHIAACAGEAVPALVIHIRLNAVQPARRYPRKGYRPVFAVQHRTFRPRNDGFPCALQRYTGLHGRSRMRHGRKLQRQLLRQMHQMIFSLTRLTKALSI